MAGIWPSISARCSCDGAHRTAGIENLQKNRRASAEESAHHHFCLAADVRRGQIDQCARAAVSAKKSAAEAHVLHRDVAVRKQGGLGRAGRAGGEDDQRAVVLGDLRLSDMSGGWAIPQTPRRSSPPPQSTRRIACPNRLLRIHHDAMLDPRALRLARRSTADENRKAPSRPAEQIRAAAESPALE